MPMKMQVVVVLVEVGMRSDQGRMAGRKFFAEPFHGAGEVEKAEQDEHEANREFHREARARRNSHAEENDGAADDGDGQRVAAAPEDADETGFGNGTLAADDGGNGDDMIGIGGVAHPEKKADGENGESGAERRIHGH